MGDLMGEDPAADFLQQEGDELRELGIDDAGFTLVNEPTPAELPPVDGGFEDPFGAPPDAAEPPPFDDGFDEPTFDMPAAEPALTNDVDFMNEFESEPVAAEPLVNGFVDAGVAEVTAPVQPIHQIVPTEEPESLAKWRADKAALLQQQEKEEADAVLSWSEKAKKETEDWYNRYNEQQEKVKNENRAAETQFLEEMTDTKPGNEWEKVARFCDFNPKLSKNTKDVSRMRSLLLQLKQTPLVR